jgi:superfamily II DNA helicase RecQ
MRTDENDSLEKGKVLGSLIFLMLEETFRPVCGIVYSPRRVLCDAIAQRLISDGIKAAAYHAGLQAKDRERILKEWVDGKELGVVVATVAFGMGVDRGDVRFVIHVELPKSIEGIPISASDVAYYQESGRAGRDRKTARCILFYSREDVERQRYLIMQTEAKRDAAGIRASQRPAGMKNFEAVYSFDFK